MPDLDHLTLGQVCAGIMIAGGVLAVLGGWLKFWRPKYRATRDTVTKALASIVGQDPIRDPATDEIIREGIPGIGVRMAQQEKQSELMSVAIQKLVDQQVHQQHLERRVDAIEADVAELKEQRVERVVTKAESIAAWKAIEATAKATPDVEAYADEDPVED